ncbi:MAG TPA: glycine zipper 2TM domain-containing protein [Burkholderiales bacterium]|nr:glycine zipper 2TM domain-containing protein [Burkholderiales bacterium]
MKWAILVATAIALPVALAGCYTPSSSGAVYTAGQTGREQSVRMGVVESVRPVTIEGTRGEIGTLAGGAVGGIAGSDVGGGKGSGVGAILGAVVGGVAGSTIERGVTQKKGVEITVRLDNGELRAIAQEADEEFRPGERVRLVTGGGKTRVTH